MFHQKVFDQCVALIEKRNEQLRPEGCPAHLLIAHRDVKKITNKLQTLKMLCSQFKATVKQCPLMSGENEDGVLKRGLEMCEAAHKDSFKLIEVHEILAESPEWMVLQAEKNEAGGGGKRSKKEQRDANRASKEHNARPIGKRRKAIADRAASTCVDLGGDSSFDDDCFSSISRSICGLTDSLAVQTWEEVDQIQFLKSEAMLKKHQKQKEILKAESELLVLKQENRKLSREMKKKRTVVASAEASTQSSSAAVEEDPETDIGSGDSDTDYE